MGLSGPDVGKRSAHLRRRHAIVLSLCETTAACLTHSLATYLVVVISMYNEACCRIQDGKALIG
eukprot:scaffold92451_cov19-Prasinocladus_malaysianus.AAC.1